MNRREMTKREESQLIQLHFDYDAHEISKSDSRALERNATAIVNETLGLWKRKAEYVFKVAKHLNAAHERLANHRNGTYEKWVKQRCGLAPSTARNIRNAAIYFRQILANNSVQIDPSAMYLLSAESCPEEATQEAIELANSGEQITHAKAKEIKAKYVGEKEPKTASERLDEILKRLHKVAEEDRDLVLLNLKVLVQELESDAD